MVYSLFISMFSEIIIINFVKYRSLQYKFENHQNYSKLNLNLQINIHWQPYIFCAFLSIWSYPFFLPKWLLAVLLYSKVNFLSVTSPHPIRELLAPSLWCEGWTTGQVVVVEWVGVVAYTISIYICGKPLCVIRDKIIFIFVGGILKFFFLFSSFHPLLTNTHTKYLYIIAKLIRLCCLFSNQLSFILLD